jgi:hypothetical protein
VPDAPGLAVRGQEGGRGGGRGGVRGGVASTGRGRSLNGPSSAPQFSEKSFILGQGSADDTQQCVTRNLRCLIFMGIPMRIYILPAQPVSIQSPVSRDRTLRKLKPRGPKPPQRQRGAHGPAHSCSAAHEHGGSSRQHAPAASASAQTHL